MSGTLLWAPRAWINGAWACDVLLRVDARGHWSEVAPDTPAPPQASVLPGAVLPGLVNAHSHAFQRAFVGLAERRALAEHAGVDAKLVALARRLQLRLLTNDVNLARVAEVQGVLTVIPRRLAADLVPGVLAGETIQVALTRAGRHPGQGVGFLEDGSMVVVNGGVDLVNAGPMSFVVSSIVPTIAGRIVFARSDDSRKPVEAPTAPIS